MSFRNYNETKDSNIKIQQGTPSQLFLASKFPNNPQNASPDQEIIAKIADIIVGLHESLLLKCQHLEIYRDLTPTQQNLLFSADKNTALHTALAGVLAIDSCLRSIEREEQFVGGNLLRANSALISHFQTLQKLFGQSRETQEAFTLFNDSLKFVTQQIQALPASRGREHELQKQLTLLEHGQDQQDREWNRGQSQDLLSDLHKQNEMLKLGLKEKQAYIKTLEGRLQRVGSKLDKNQERRTSFTSRSRIPEKNNEFQGVSQIQMAQEQVIRLRDQLQEKGKIVFKMNQQFASQMEKYNSVFRRLQEQNRILKKYNDIDASYLLEELQMEIDLLRQQKRKDQLIISDIQRRLQGFSFTRNSRVPMQDRPQYIQFDRYEQGFPEPMPQASQYFERNHNLRPQSKYYSPNYTSRMMSPFQRGQHYREEGYIPAETYRTRGSRREEPKNKSRSRHQGLQQSRQSREPIEAKSTPTINLLQRVMAKRM